MSARIITKMQRSTEEHSRAKAKGIIRVLIDDLPLGQKRTGILAIYRGKQFPVGWFSATNAARKRRRDRRKHLRAKLQDLLLSRRIRESVAALLGIMLAWWLIPLAYKKDWSGWQGKNLWDWMKLLIVPL